MSFCGALVSLLHLIKTIASMNKLLLLSLSLFFSISAFSQADVVTWNFQSKKLDGNKYEVKLIATLKNPWHIYSTTQPDGGPLPTKITFTKNPLAVPDGQVKEVGKLETHFEKVFDLDTKYFNNKVEFVQVVALKGKAKTNVSGTVEFMVCNEKECLPPKEVPFSVALK